MIIMPSLTALAGRAGDWDGAFISATKPRTGGKTSSVLLLQLQSAWKHYSSQGDKV